MVCPGTLALKFIFAFARMPVVLLSKLIVPNLRWQHMSFVVSEVLKSQALTTIHFLAKVISRKNYTLASVLDETTILRCLLECWWVRKLSFERFRFEILFVPHLVLYPVVLVLVEHRKRSFLLHFLHLQIKWNYLRSASVENFPTRWNQ